MHLSYISRWSWHDATATDGRNGHAAANAVRGTTTFFSTPQLRGRDGNRPLYLYASHPELGDAFLALDRTPIEIDTPGGLGPLNSGPLDLWLKADRGAYREGETARVAGLLQRHAREMPPAEHPVLVGRIEWASYNVRERRFCGCCGYSRAHARQTLQYSPLANFGSCALRRQ